ncbi:hypothetical protein [Humisphaera borealis]|uniref:Yip1 domain-containing protein n=1 Tax=Humisphaera borealis TaxID=2807512 RepID=A0A7M2X1R1_9BACT|nr:hypothetical protein [Humisphaera borealis]QOV91382.1 hypothetical protein IPV69_08525 [Humisphaera borealis]
MGNAPEMRLSGNQPLLLGYRGTVDRVASTTGPLWPLLSTLPGLFCWLLFASAAMPRELPILERLGGLFGTRGANVIIFVTWGLAVATSVVTLIVYANRSQAWYTTLCLAIHLAGLSFSLLLLGGLAVLLVA